jgi:hypothetical protein
VLSGKSAAAASFLQGNDSSPKFNRIGTAGFWFTLWAWRVLPSPFFVSAHFQNSIGLNLPARTLQAKNGEIPAEQVENDISDYLEMT